MAAASSANRSRSSLRRACCFGARALDRKRDLRRDHAGQLQVVRRQRVRLVVIQHELADDAPEADERNEGHRRDAFGLDGRQQGGERRFLRDVGNDDRFRVRAVGCQGVWPSTAPR